MPTACQRLAGAAEAIAAGESDGRAFLVRLGRDAAGVGAGPMVLWGLLRAGRTRIRGGGFRPELADHSGSQARHFVGTARAVTVLGPGATRWISEHVRRDPADSADGRLGVLAIEFAEAILDGSLPTGEAGDWIRGRLCVGD